MDAELALTSPASAAVPAQIDDGPAAGFTVTGIMLGVVGLWLLFVQPGDGTELGGSPIINIHRVALGITATLAGVVFMAIGSVHRAIGRMRAAVADSVK